MLPAVSFTPVVILVLYVVVKERLADGSTVKVLPELESEGDELIWTQVLKLSEDTLKVPEQVVFVMLVVTEVLSIASENVTEMLSLTETPLWLSVGEIEETAGAIASITMALPAPKDPEEPGAGRVKLALLDALSRIDPLFADSELVEV